MIKVLPFVLIPVLILSALGYWRLVYLPKQSLTATNTAQNIQPVEVPKSLPGATVDQRLVSLEQSIQTLAGEINGIKGSAAPQSSSALDSRVTNAESAIVELKARVSALENGQSSATTQTSSSAFPLYIPLGSGGSGSDTNWVSVPNYEIMLNPADYSGYSNMQLEVNFKLPDIVGTAYIRLFNVSDNNTASSEISTTSGNFVWLSSSGFSLASGNKTYKLQVKSSQGRTVEIQSARIKVNF